MTPRSVRVLVAGVVLPVLLLSIGWVFASFREHRIRLELARRDGIEELDRSARGVEAQLEELRRREGDRPFYVYNHYYVPPDLLTITDAVAVSPLATPSDDERVVGWFQVEPDGTVQTPLAPEPSATPGVAEVRLRAIARSHALAELRARVAGRDEGSLVARARADASPRPQTRRVRVRRLVAVAAAPSSNVAVEQRSMANTLAEQIQSQQAPEFAQQFAPAPVRYREQVTYEHRTLEQSPNPIHLLPTVAAEVEVETTPMAWYATDDAFVLARVVSEADSAVLQGVAFDRRAMEAWIGRAARTNADPRHPPSVADGTRRCRIEARTSSFPPGVHLCAAAGALASVERRLGEELRRELAALSIVVALSGLALVFAIRAMRREAELARRRSDFVSAVSHELRTPLTTMRMHAEMLAEGLVTDERKSRVHDELVRESLRLSRLIENVLVVSRIESGKQVLTGARGDLSAFVGRVVEDQRSVTESIGMRQTFVSAGAIDLSFDPEAIERIVTNLLENARKYASDSEVKAIEVEVRASRTGAELLVRDRGPGIPAEERERVFERFHRVVRPADAHRPGTGLGLALVRELARAHGGDAQAREANGGGAEIAVTLASLEARFA